MLVGRAHEQQVVDRLLAAARVGGSGTLLVTGEPGIGKSAVLDDARRRAGSMRVLAVRGAVAEREVSFAGLHQLCGPLAPLFDRLPEPQQDALGVALRTRSGPSPDRFGVGVATLGLLSRAADDRPLLVLVDDAHLLDRPSAEAVVFAARRLVNDRVAVLVALRPSPASPFVRAGLSEMRLRGLDVPAARALVGDDRLEALHAATAGNPLALLELAHRPDDLRRLDAGVPVPLHRGLQVAFAARAAGLPEPTRRVLLLAAAGTTDLALVDRACRPHGLDVGALVPAEVVGLVTIAAGAVEFRHPLVRAAVYGAADPRLRRWAHAALAEALAQAPAEATGGRRAWHLAEAAVGPDELVASALQTAAVDAGARGAHSVAASMLERAAGLSPSPPDRTARSLEAAAQSWLAGQPGRTLDLLDAVLPGASPEQRVRVSELRGAIEARCGSLATARDILLEGAATAAAFDRGRAVLLLADAVHACFYLGDIGAALDAADRVVGLVGADTPTSVRCVGLTAAGVAHVLAGHGDRGAALVRAGLDVPLGDDRFEELDDPLRVQWPVVGPLFLREGSGARDRLGDLVERLRARAASAHLSLLLGNVARDDATTDRWADAEAGYLEAVRLADELGQTTDAAFALAGLAWLQARRGEDAAARASAARAGELGERHEVHLARAWAAFALGDLEAGAGRPEEAEAHYRALVALLADHGIADPDLSPAPELCEVLVATGRQDEARELAEGHLRRAQDKGQPWSLARAHRAAGTSSAGGDDAEAHLEEALAQHARTSDAYELARTRLAFGSRVRRDRRPAGARPLLEEALETFDRLGARPWADRAAAELRATGRTVRRSGVGVLEQLTPQERQTAQLLAAGRTTREAAAALFLSPKTVEFHLRNVYIKLGIHSRAELAQAMSGRP